MGRVVHSDSNATQLYSRFNGVMLSRRSRRTREFEMYRSSREGVSEGVGSCTCQNGVTQTRVRGGTEIIRTPSAGARASSPCASRRMPKTVALAPRRRPRESRDTALLRRHRRDEARSVRHRRAPRGPQKQTYHKNLTTTRTAPPTSGTCPRTASPTASCPSTPTTHRRASRGSRP